MITRPVRRLMLMQGVAGMGIGACSAAGIPLVGGVGTGVNLAVLAPTAVIHIRPMIGNLSLPARWFLPLTICSALLAIASASVFSGVGAAIGVIGWLAVVEPAVRIAVVSYLDLAVPTIAVGKTVLKAIR
jgi:hypothetical protein